MIMGFHRYNVPISLSAVNTHSFSAFANHNTVNKRIYCLPDTKEIIAEKLK